MDIKLTRRQLLKGAAVLGAGLALPLKFDVKSAHAFYQSPGLQMWMTALRGVGPGQIPVVATDGVANVTGVAHATIAIQQFTDQLHPALGPTKLWGFQPVNPLGGGVQPPKHLGGIIVAERNTPLQLTFRNNLPAKNIIPVDTTLPGANQAQNRIAVHIHGGLVPWISDGGPFDWWAPNGTHGASFLNNFVLNPAAAGNEAEYYYPNRQSARLIWYHDHAFGITRVNAYAGVATAYVIRDNFERAMIPMGLPPFIETSVLGGTTVLELPLVIQDKTFVGPNIGSADPTWVAKGLPSTPGSLWYPHVYEKNRWRLIGAGRNLPNPSVVAEMFGDTMLVNGTVYPQVTVEARRYRFRILNACNARFLNLQLLIADSSADGITLTNGVPDNAAGPNWLVLGNESGFLTAPYTQNSKVPFSLDANGSPVGSLVTGNAERWDALVDFSGLAGSSVILYSDTPAPFPFGDDRYDYYYGNGLNPFSSSTEGYGPDTRVLMKFNVVAPTGSDLPLTLTSNWDPGIDPPLATLNPDGSFTPLVPVNTTRTLTLNENFDAYGRLTQMLGTDTAVSGKLGRPYTSTATELPASGDVEVWQIINLTGDSHPIHFHLVNVQVLNRQEINAAAYTGGPPDAFLMGNPIPPNPGELGWKETVQMHPGQVTRVIMKFDLTDAKIRDTAGNPIDLTSKGGTAQGDPPVSPRTGGYEYVWHCHILEHEEHDMMRPLVVQLPPV